jgi:hypothetical protein
MMRNKSMQSLDWEKLPLNLRHFAKFAEKYGHYQFEDKIYEFLGHMSKKEESELAMLLRSYWIPEETQINAWLSEYSITEHIEARHVYFLGHLLALGSDAGFFKSSGP